MKTSLIALIAVLSLSLVAPLAAADSFLVERGRPRAEIVIAERPARSARLAAHELQAYIEKLSGARLDIVTQPSGNFPVSVFIGRSSHTDQRKLDVENLKFGAFRMVSGANWLALLGDDKDFVPREPWARNNNDRVSGKLQRQWEMLSGDPFGVPNGGMYKNRARLPGEIGLPRGANPLEQLEIWGFDERGSYNAVCEFLRRLGVRWYLPGELGEIVPRRTSIPLPAMDEVVKPDFEVRQFNIRFATVTEATMRWAMRLGIRNPYGLMIAHGMHTMTEPDELKRAHPEWFALYGEERDIETDKRLNHLCYSNQQLFDATVRWARSQFDVYDFESVSIMPPDAYISICQCDLCAGKDAPEMGSRGKLSNHVWGFVNRVAKEVGRTHPGKKIVCCAYGANTLPPTNIDRLAPNVQVVIVGGRRPRNSLPEQREPIRELRAGWIAKTANPIMVFENYPFTGRGMYLPAFVAQTIGESINATKGVSRGEDIWLTIGRDFDTKDIGFNHFQVYFTARMYWGGKSQDVNAMLDEYCRLFYGPAGTKMRTFFDFCESHWQSMDKSQEQVETALNMFAAAKARVEEGGVYARRLALIDEFLEPLRSKATLLSQKRGPVPKLRTVWEPRERIVVDGRLDDQYWTECPTASTGQLRELQTGRQPLFGTTVKAGWDQGGQNLYFGIRCDERAGEALNVKATKDEDQSIWYGDVVEIHLATDSHNYYQLAVNPAGALVDLDRAVEKQSWFRWQSQAEVATQVADDYWTVEIRIPVTDDPNDPLNQVVGRKPSQSLPWHFNVCRQRIRKNGSEYSAFSPTGTAGFHVPMKFAHFYDGRSHQFAADPNVNDYLIARNAASQLLRRRKLPSAFDALTALAQREGNTDLQRSDALTLAAETARRMSNFDDADELAAKIPIDAVAKTVQMENLLGRREWSKLIEQFGAEALEEWPFWQIGAGAFARGRAYHAAKQGKRADDDFALALQWTSDDRTRVRILRMRGQNFESVLDDEKAALTQYQEVVSSKSNTGGADYLYAVQGAARILTRQRRFDQALQVLRGAPVDQLRGLWRHSMQLTRAATLAAAGRNGEALRIYREVIADESAGERERNAARRAVEKLQPDNNK